MKERGASEEEAEDTIRNPDLLMPSIKGRSNAFKYTGGRYLRVTLKEEDDGILVITVTIRKRPFSGGVE